MRRTMSPPFIIVANFLSWHRDPYTQSTVGAPRIIVVVVSQEAGLKRTPSLSKNLARHKWITVGRTTHSTLALFISNWFPIRCSATSFIPPLTSRPNQKDWTRMNNWTMQLSNAASAIADYFVYYGGEGEIGPEDLTRVRIHSSFRAMKGRAFWGRRQLMIVMLNDGLEEIGKNEFDECTSIHKIIIPNVVKMIKDGAFMLALGWRLWLSVRGWRRLGRHFTIVHC